MRRPSRALLPAAIAAALLAAHAGAARAHGPRVGIGIGVGVGVGHGWGPAYGVGGFRPGWGYGWHRPAPRVGVTIGAPLFWGVPSYYYGAPSYYYGAPVYPAPWVVGPPAYVVPAGPPAYVAPPAYTGPPSVPPASQPGPPASQSAPPAPRQGPSAAQPMAPAGASTSALPPAGYAVFSCPNAALVSQLADAAGRSGLSSGGAGAILGALVGGEAGSRMDVREQACIGQALEMASEGQRVSWGGSFAAAQYAVVAGAFESRDGITCRRFEAEVMAEGASRRASGSACRRGDGLWVAQAG